MDVGIRELKAKLSEYIERAARGESIRVTDRGIPKAVLTPIPGVARLEQGRAEGWIVRAADELPQRIQRVHASMSSAELIAEDRGE